MSTGKRYDFFYGMIRLLVLCAVIPALLLTIGCAGGNYGRMDRDRGLDNMFLSYQVLPDHRYYTSGGYDYPKAILAVQNSYELDNEGGLWVPVPNVNSAQIRKWIDTIAPEQNYRWSNNYFAAYILDPEGNRVGAWYSIENQTTVKFLGDNRIQVYPPEQNRDLLNMNRGFRLGGGI